MRELRIARHGIAGRLRLATNLQRGRMGLDRYFPVTLLALRFGSAAAREVDGRADKQTPAKPMWAKDEPEEFAETPARATISAPSHHLNATGAGRTSPRRGASKRASSRTPKKRK